MKHTDSFIAAGDGAQMETQSEHRNETHRIDIEDQAPSKVNLRPRKTKIN